MIQQCALEHDLKLFDAGDMTEVGEKGLTLRRVDSLRSATSDNILTLMTFM